jgi:hypothetical protein
MENCLLSYLKMPYQNYWLYVEWDWNVIIRNDQQVRIWKEMVVSHRGTIPAIA